MSETYSILIADVRGEIPLLNKIGAKETERAVDRCRNRAERTIESNEGEFVQAEGHRLVARFKRCENAVLAAFDMRNRVAQLPPVSGVSLLVRISLHVGNPDSGAIEAAKALAEITPNDQIFVSEQALSALPESFHAHINQDACMDVPAHELRAYPFKPDTGITHLKEALIPTATSLSLQNILAATGPLSEPPEPSPSSQPKASLRLRHENHNFVVSDLRPVLLAGREDGNDLVITDKRASRHHARVEWRQSRFVLIDTSTNGTYLSDDQGTEVVLRRSEADLPQRGRIGFGYSTTEPDAEAVFFDINQR